VKGSLLAATLLGIPYLVFKLGLIERISTQKLIQYQLQTIRKGFEEEGLSSVEFWVIVQSGITKPAGRIRLSRGLSYEVSVAAYFIYDLSPQHLRPPLTLKLSTYKSINVGLRLRSSLQYRVAVLSKRVDA